VENLDADAIAARLDALHREEKALRALYKVARQRGRTRPLTRRPELLPDHGRTEGGPSDAA
jgi:hypothetical protein